MRISNLALAPVLAALALAACDQKPAGPVAATVDGEAITVAALDAEMKAADIRNSTDPQVRSAVLERVIARKLMAKAARDEKLDQTPEAKAVKAATVENFEAGLAQKAALDTVKAPTAAEAQAFMDANPAMFAQRKLYLIDVMQLAQPGTPELAELLRPINDYDQIGKVLTERKIAFRRSTEQLDALTMPPNVAAQVAAVPAGTPFVLPAQSGLAVARVRASRDAPALGPQAVTVAQQMLTNQRRQAAITDRLKGLVDASRAKTTYGEGYGPPEKAAAAK